MMQIDENLLEEEPFKHVNGHYRMILLLMLGESSLINF